MHIFVGGSLTNVPRDKELCRRFAAALGVAIVKKEHYLMNGCRSEFDKEIAKAAHKWLERNDRKNARKRIISYYMQGEKPIHDFGRVRSSELSDWNMNHRRLIIPEQIEQATAAIFVAGNEGTYWAKNWAYYARRPILGVPRFGGAGEDIYAQELKRLRMDSPSMGADFERINDPLSQIASYAKQVVALAEQLAVPRVVSTIMSFKDEYLPVYNSFRFVCRKFGFEAYRTDQSQSLERVIPHIENGIRNSPFVIADVSEESPNVLYEVGFASALGKAVILTARKGTELPFDLIDLPTIFWELHRQEDLRDNLRKYIGKLRARLDT